MVWKSLAVMFVVALSAIGLVVWFVRWFDEAITNPPLPPDLVLDPVDEGKEVRDESPV